MATDELTDVWKREPQIGGNVGWQKGWHTGWQEGRRNGYQRALIDVYEARFGVLLEDLANLIRAERDIMTLCEWLKLIGTGTADEVTARLLASLEAPEPRSAPTPSAG